MSHPLSVIVFFLEIDIHFMNYDHIV